MSLVVKQKWLNFMTTMTKNSWENDYARIDIGHFRVSIEKKYIYLCRQTGVLKAHLLATSIRLEIWLKLD